MLVRQASHVEARGDIERRGRGDNNSAAGLHRGEELRRVVLAGAERRERAAGTPDILNGARGRVREDCG